jgi:hypothetical protein
MGAAGVEPEAGESDPDNFSGLEIGSFTEEELSLTFALLPAGITFQVEVVFCYGLTGGLLIGVVCALFLKKSALLLDTLLVSPELTGLYSG